MNFTLAGTLRKNITEISAILATIPNNYISLVLTDNFSSRTTAELVEIFKAIPQTIKKLTLNLDDINTRSEEDLIALAKALPYLMEIELYDLNGKDVTGKTFAILQKHIGSWVQEANFDISDLDIPTHLSNLIINQVIGSDPTSFTAPSVRERREKILSDFNIHLLEICSKANELNCRGLVPACDAAYGVQSALQTLRERFYEGAIGLATFKTDSLKAIKQARPELEKHRGWADILTNIAYCILGLGVGYLIACAYKGRFFHVKTDSENKLNALENSVAEIGKAGL